jgi:hypothetical protein
VGQLAAVTQNELAEFGLALQGKLRLMDFSTGEIILPKIRVHFFAGVE